jgi:hypothetical protein
LRTFLALPSIEPGSRIATVASITNDRRRVVLIHTPRIVQGKKEARAPFGAFPCRLVAKRRAPATGECVSACTASVFTHRSNRRHRKWARGDSRKRARTHVDLWIRRVVSSEPAARVRVCVSGSKADCATTRGAARHWTSASCTREALGPWSLARGSSSRSPRCQSAWRMAPA